jgi:hypothetical protein
MARPCNIRLIESGVKVVADDLDLAGQNRVLGARCRRGRRARPGLLRDSRASPIGLTRRGDDWLHRTYRSCARSH